METGRCSSHPYNQYDINPCRILCTFPASIRNSNRKHWHLDEENGKKMKLIEAGSCFYVSI